MYCNTLGDDYDEELTDWIDDGQSGDYADGVFDVPELYHDPSTDAFWRDLMLYLFSTL